MGDLKVVSVKSIAWTFVAAMALSWLSGFVTGRGTARPSPIPANIALIARLKADSTILAARLHESRLRVDSVLAILEIPALTHEELVEKRMVSVSSVGVDSLQHILVGPAARPWVIRR